MPFITIKAEVKLNKKIIDLHCHIIPDVDDGSPDMTTSLDMLRIAQQTNVSVIACSSHCLDPFDMFQYEIYSEGLERLRKVSDENDIDIRLASAAEVRADRGIEEADLDLWSINSGRYVLIEFYFNESASTAFEIVSKVIKRGFIPVIAHPERYSFMIYDPDNASILTEMGCFLQLNKGSLLGDFGSQPLATANYLLKNELCHFIGSDAHSSTWRNPDFSDITEYLIRETGEKRAERLLRDNAFYVINNENPNNIQS